MNQIFREKPPASSGVGMQLPASSGVGRQPPLVKQKVRGRTKSEKSETAPKRKAKIPAAIQEAIWILKMGRVFEGKCLTTWCPNIITVFDYHAGHDIPESKGGDVSVENLYPICARCNLSMGDRYTFKQWSAMSPPLQEPLRGPGAASEPLRGPGAAFEPPPLVPIVPPKKSWWCC